MENQISEKTKRDVIHGIKKADIVLIVVCLVAAALLGVFFVIHRETGRQVRILHDGIELKKIDLYSAQTDSEIEPVAGYYLITIRDDVVGVEYFRDKPEPKLPEGTSYNLISVVNGTVVMEAADCRDQICVHHKPVSSKGESIICLPHRIVIEVDSGENTDEPLDGVVR
ncbi:MAG: NusG domain II-containing protein [Lachnospiraceae bacterium]|nr:NusG domain II-containing protein [Lachnospiraceae bacterium]